MRGTIAIGGTLAALLLAAPGAGAAVEVGSTCTANDSEVDWTVIGLERAGNPFPSEVLEQGVITRWRVEVKPGKGGLAQKLQVFRPAAPSAYFTVVGESAVEDVVDGVNYFSTRIPVESRDHIGLYGPGENGPGETLFCDKEEADKGAVYEGEVPLGSTLPFKTEDELGVPVIATLEPDADNDGYGDETQDGCPRSGLFVGDCPAPVALKLKRKLVRKRSIQLRVVSTGEASVDVYGQVGWNFQPKRRTHRKHDRRARAHISKKKGVKRLIVGLVGDTKPVEPGILTRFNIRLPKPVLLRLSRLTKRQSIRAKITLRATNPAGITKNTRVRVKLRGWRPIGRR